MPPISSANSSRVNCTRPSSTPANATGLSPCACTNPQTVRVKEEYLHAVSSLVGKEKQMTRARVLLQPANDQRVQALKSESHVRVSGGHKNARSRAHPQHGAMPLRARRSTWSEVGASKPDATPRRPPIGQDQIDACIRVGRCAEEGCSISSRGPEWDRKWLNAPCPGACYATAIAIQTCQRKAMLTAKSERVRPLCSYSNASRSASLRLRRRRATEEGG